MTVGELLADVAMEHKLRSYKVKNLAGSRISLDTDARPLEDEELVIEEVVDPWIEDDNRLRITYNLLYSEREYLDQLRSIFEVYAEPLRKFSSLTNDDHRILFVTLEPILSLSSMLCCKLEDCVKLWQQQTTSIGSLFSKQFWHQYDEYYEAYVADTHRLLNEKKEEDGEFVQFCKLRQGSSLLSLETLLLLPVQRIPHYERYLSELLADTENDHPDFENLTKATNRVAMMVKDRESDLNHVENETKVESVQDRFPNDDLNLKDQLKTQAKGNTLLRRRKSAPGAVLLKSLKGSRQSITPPATPTSHLIPDLATATRPRFLPDSSVSARKYILEGAVTLSAGLQTQERYLFLFNDLLLVGKQKSSTTFKLKHRVRVCEVWTAECLDEVSEVTRTSDRSFVLGWPTTNVVVTFSSPDMKDIWCEKLKEHIIAEKEKEQPRAVPVKIVNKDIDNNLPAYKTILVNNDEEAHEVVQRCMGDFNITQGEAKDYQLWVRSGKEDAPYPLFGHEHPYSIKMSHVRNHATKNGISDQEALSSLVDGADNEMQCQFILRETKKKLSTEDSSKRLKKSKKSPLPLKNFFKKSSKAPLELQSTPSGPTGRLFGHPLVEVVSDEQPVPKPILDLMQAIFTHGIFSAGIFRKPGNEKRKRELQEILDNNDEYNLDEENILVLSSTLKEFFRSLPECLLVSDMYNQWIDSLSVTPSAEQIDRLRSIVQSLPPSHVSVMRYLFSLLHHIDAHSEENCMTASNLAICIAPSLLWCPQMPQGEVLEKVPQLIAVLIQQAGAIFGEDCLSLFGEEPNVPEEGNEENKPHRDSSTDSDSMHSLLSIPEAAHRDNSSIDSLERDSYGGGSEIESSPRCVMKASHLSPTNLSRDSGLYSSDNQLYEDSTAESEPMSQQRQLVTRSVSQFDDQKQKLHNIEAMSKSYDGVMDAMSGLGPVAPPRKHRVPPGVESVPRTKVISMRPGGPNMADVRRNKYLGQPSKRISNDSLGSLDEYSEAESRNYDDFQHLQSHGDIGILHKSESGARLYLNEDLIHSQKATSNKPMEQLLAPPENPHQYHSNVKRRDVVPPPSMVNRSSWGGEYPMPPQLDLSASYSGQKLYPRHPAHINLSASYSGSSLQPHFSTTSEESTEGEEYKSVDFSVGDQEEDVEIVKALDKSKPVPINKPQPKTVAVIDVPHGLITQQYMQMAGDIRKRQPRAGMTSKGSDIFPTHILKKRAEEELRRSYDSGIPSCKAPVPVKADRSQSFTKADIPRSAQLVRQVNLEKSASDTKLPSRALTRPDKPPTYQEALKRKSMLASSSQPGLYHITEQDAMQEKIKQERARRLYEQSLKMYSEQQQQQSRDPSCDAGYSSEPLATERSLPTYEQAVQRAEQIKRSSPPRSSPSKDNNLSSNGKSSQSTAKDSEKHKKSQRTRRHHAHRFSDTRLEKRSDKSRVVKVARSKSDSSEHINKLAKLQYSAIESTDSEDEWYPVVMRSKRVTKSVERSPSKEKVRTQDIQSGHESVCKSAERVVVSKAEIVPLRSKSGSKQSLSSHESVRDARNIQQETKKSRPRIQSLRNRDWHKELTETYSKSQPETKEQPKIQYAYIRSTPQEAPTDTDIAPAQRRRSWVPPVHPTKDLVVLSNPRPSSVHYKDYTLRNMSPAPKSVNIEEKKSMSLPGSPTKQQTYKPQQASSQPLPQPSSSQPISRPHHPSQQSSSDRPASDSDSDGGFISAQPSGLSWSVAKLRNLYDETKEVGGQTGQMYASAEGLVGSSTRRVERENAGYVREKVNPHAEEAYI